MTEAFLMSMSGHVVNALIDVGNGSPAITVTGFLSVTQDQQVIKISPIGKKVQDEISERDSNLTAYFINDISADAYFDYSSLKVLIDLGPASEG